MNLFRFKGEGDMNIKDIRVVQKLRKVKEYTNFEDGLSLREINVKTSWTLQIKRDSLDAEWEDVQVIEEYEDAA